MDRALVAETPMAFGDLAVVVFYLRVAPWAVDRFDAAADRAALERIHDLIQREAVWSSGPPTRWSKLGGGESSHHARVSGRHRRLWDVAWELLGR